MHRASVPRLAFVGIGLGITCSLALAEPPAPTHAPAHVAAEAKPAKQDKTDRWYTVEMMGGKAGWMHSQEVHESGKIITRSKMQISMGRGATGAEIVQSSEFVETEDGKPVSMRSMNKMGKMVLEKSWTFMPDGVERVTKQAGNVEKKTLPLPAGEWMTPAALERAMLAEFKAGKKEIVAKTISPETEMEIVTQTRIGFEPEKVMVDDTPVDAIRTKVSTDMMGGIESTEWIDSEGELIKNETSMGGISVVMTRTSKALAQAEGDGVAPEVMVKTFVKPDKTIDDPRHATRGVYVLSVHGDAMPELPTGASQRVEKLHVAGGDDTVRVTVDWKHPVKADPADATNTAFLASTSTADLTDEKLRALMDKTLIGAPADKAARAELLRRAVNAHISKKSMGVAMATASEVVRTREGDCSEHGVLLAAMLRADGIPSRIAMGIIYAEEFAGQENIFGYHMWAQALLPTKDGMAWVDLDGTFPDSIVFDATHICIGTSDMGDGSLNPSLVGLARVLGRLDVKVEKVEHAGDRHEGDGK